MNLNFCQGLNAPRITQETFPANSLIFQSSKFLQVTRIINVIGISFDFINTDLKFDGGFLNGLVTARSLNPSPSVRSAFYNCIDAVWSAAAFSFSTSQAIC
jgi:hypothetical protein